MKSSTLLSLILVIGCLSCSENENVVTNVSYEQPIPQLEEAFPGVEKEIVSFSNGLVLPKVDSLYIFQGDIILTDEQLEELTQPHTRGSGLNHIRRWIQGEVPYAFASGFTKTAEVNAAISHYHDNTNIRLIPRTNQTDYIEFFNGNGNYSNLGQVGGKQQISIASGNNSTTGTVIHEIGHAVGLIHEQSRPDRNDYITVLWDNIQPSSDIRFNFEIYNTHSLFSTPEFDFNSIMLYSSMNSFSVRTGLPTMVRNSDQQPFEAQRRNLSPGDITVIDCNYPYKDLEIAVPQDLTVVQNPNKIFTFRALNGFEESTYSWTLTYPAMIQFPLESTTATQGLYITRVPGLPATGSTHRFVIQVIATRKQRTKMATKIIELPRNCYITIEPNTLPR